MANELVEYFHEKFQPFKVEVLRLARASAGRVTHALNTLKLQGLTLEGILEIIRGEVNTHEQNNNYPHGETLSSMQGMARATFDSLTPAYFPRDGIPVSRIPATGATVDPNGVMHLTAFTMLYFGRPVYVGPSAIQLTGVDKKYIRVKISGEAPSYYPEVEVSASGVEDVRTLTFGTVQVVNGSYVVTLEATVRIGVAPLSPHPRGGGIPYAPGSQAEPGTTPPGWYV